MMSSLKKMNSRRNNFTDCPRENDEEKRIENNMTHEPKTHVKRIAPVNLFPFQIIFSKQPVVHIEIASEVINSNEMPVMDESRITAVKLHKLHWFNARRSQTATACTLCLS